MNESSIGSLAHHANGILEPQMTNGSTSHIVEALDLSHRSDSSKDTRRQALEYLEAQKTKDDAPYHGFLLASDRQQSPLVRHFGLSLLEHVIRHRWNQLSDDQTLLIRNWVLGLADQVQEQDPIFLRNKIAQLCADVAKRSWGIDWLDFDEVLVTHFDRDLVHKELVLTALETLSEDVFYREDTAAALRGNELNTALMEIFTPRSVYSGNEQTPIRFGNDGWLARIAIYLEACTQKQLDKASKTCAVKAIATLRSVLSWVMAKAIVSTHCLQSICMMLDSPDTEILMAAVEALHALYSRAHFEEDDFRSLVCPMYHAENVTLLRKLYEWSIVDASDIDEVKYTISKKFSEIISHLSGFIEEKPSSLPEGTDLSFFFHLMIMILRHDSMIVSIPILHSWTKLLGSDMIGTSDLVFSLVGPLLEVASGRLVRYEALPDDSEEPAILFLNEDIDTIPERHAFLGNYRRYCIQIIEIIVLRTPQEAISHILSQVDAALGSLYQTNPPFDPSSYKKTSPAVLQVDCQFTVVEAALKGYNKWLSSHGKHPEQDEQLRTAIELHLEAWASDLLEKTFEDPLIKQRVIKLVVEFSTKALEQQPSFSLKVLEHILVSQPAERPEYPAYSEAVKELQSISTHELRRLSMRYADYFSNYYEQLESKIQQILTNSSLEEKQQAELQSTLLIIAQRATNMDHSLRHARLHGFAQPVERAWVDSDLTQSLTTFKSFCQLLGVDKVGPYLLSQQAQSIQDWSSIGLSAEGKAIQDEMNSRFSRLPLRQTKTMMAVSTEKVKPGSPPYDTACELWHDAIPAMLPNVLQLLGHAHMFHSPDSWSDLTPEMQAIVKRVLMDRFWQAGISSGSRDEFYAKITTTKTTLEGFASSVRGKVRTARESCYSILFCMSRLGEQFYGFEELPEPLSRALFESAHHLSSHQFSIMLNMVRYLIDDCPVQYRSRFLPPVLSALFSQVDRKVSAEWESIEHRKGGNGVDDNLTEEMKEESILRQLTYSAVMMVTGLLDPQRSDSSSADPNNTNGDPNANPSPTSAGSMRNFILSSPTILEPLILFSTHALRMRDTRCCTIITRVLRSILSHFVHEAPATNSAIREFIATDVLKAAITSVHEPYFVDLQKDLAQLIASIWIYYGPLTTTVRSVLCSLPGLTEDKVDRTAATMRQTNNSRTQRALVLDLLEGLRGVRISEMGKIDNTDPRKERSRMQKRYMEAKMEEDQGQSRVNQGSTEADDADNLAGVAEIFG